MSERKVAMLLSNAFKPDRRVLKQATSLTRAGYLVKIIAWDRLGEHPPVEDINGITVHRVQVRSSYSAGSSQVRYLPRYWLEANKLLSAYGPDVVHCHDLDTMPAGFVYARSRRLPLIYDAHECYPDTMRTQTNVAIYSALVVLDRFMTRRATYVITVGQLIAEHFRGLGARRLAVVGNYQPLEEYEGVAATNRDDYRLPKNSLLVAYIGGFRKERLLQPLVEVSALVDGVTVVLAGDGPHRATLEAAVASHPNARYIGWVPLDQLPAVTKMVDVVYYGLKSDKGNSRYSAPNSLFNAMAAGKPVLTTNIGEIARIVSAEQCGIVIPEANARSLAAALERLKENETRAEMSEKAVYAARRRYNWAVSEKALLDVYGSIV